MENIVIYPKNKSQENLLKSLLKEMKVQFNVLKSEEKVLLTDEEFYAKIDRSLKQAKEGKVITLSKEKQREFLGL